MNFFILLVLVSGIAIASEEPTQAIVTQSKGQEVKIIIPRGKVLKVGDIVYLDKPQPTERIVESAPTYIVSDASRNHSIDFSLSIESTKMEGSRSSSTDLRVGYAYNFGYIEPFVNYAHITSDDGTFKTKVSGLGTGLEANFIPNIPGNSFIPYLSLGAEYLWGEAGPAEVEAGGLVLGLGIKCFVSEQLALKFGYYTLNHNVDYEVDGRVIMHTSLKKNNLVGGLQFYF